MADRKKIGLAGQMGIGMVLGVIAGLLASQTGFDAQWFKPFGQLFINMVRMVVVPLVFATLVSGAASISDISRHPSRRVSEKAPRDNWPDSA